MITRRKLLKGVCAAVLAPVIVRGQRSPITIAGQPVEIVVAPISRSTARITVKPIVNGLPQNAVNRGALVAAADQRVTSGDLLVRITEGPSPTISISRAGRPVQTLTFSDTESSVTMPIGGAPILGLGEGGPQFDRRGNDLPTRNGQGGYQLRTHGGRVPIQ